MVIEPKIRGNVCFTAHPVGCEVQVNQQIRYVRNKGPIAGPGKVLVIGSSNGYGLAARIVSVPPLPPSAYVQCRLPCNFRRPPQSQSAYKSLRQKLAHLNGFVLRPSRWI